jgi:hypothetical protein
MLLLVTMVTIKCCDVYAAIWCGVCGLMLLMMMMMMVDDDSGERAKDVQAVSKMTKTATSYTNKETSYKHDVHSFVP